MPNEEAGLVPVVPVVPVVVRKKRIKGKAKREGVTFIVKNARNPKLAVVSEFIRSLNTGDGAENISGKIIIG